MPASQGELQLDANQLREYVVRPTLVHIGLWSAAAENLVLGTAVHESHLDYVRQLGQGPALGITQIEPATHDDIWSNYLAYHPGLAEKVKEILGVWPEERSDHLMTNLAYAVALCRVHYRRVPTALPVASDVPALAAYWKRYYNTAEGKGTVEQFIESYDRAH